MSHFVCPPHQNELPNAGTAFFADFSIKPGTVFFTRGLAAKTPNPRIVTGAVPLHSCGTAFSTDFPVKIKAISRLYDIATFASGLAYGPFLFHFSLPQA